MRILIADDESIIRLGLKAMLQRLGHEVVTAVDGRDALRQAERWRPDLAILDIKMPFTDGLQVAHTLSRRRPLPIILLTAYSQTELIDKATDLPIHGYLVKPVREGDLAGSIAVAGKRFAEAQVLAARAEELAGSLAERKLIERAKGRLMAEGMSEEDAYRAMQQAARRRRESLRAVAEAILGGEGA